MWRRLVVLRFSSGGEIGLGVFFFWGEGFVCGLRWVVFSCIKILGLIRLVDRVLGCGGLVFVVLVGFGRLFIC